MSQGRLSALEGGKGKEMGSPLEPPAKKQPYNVLILDPEPCRTSDLQNQLYCYKFVLF
jgi:hypothetical protein